MDCAVLVILTGKWVPLESSWSQAFTCREDFAIAGGRCTMWALTVGAHSCSMKSFKVNTGFNLSSIFIALLYKICRQTYRLPLVCSLLIPIIAHLLIKTIRAIVFINYCLLGHLSSDNRWPTNRKVCGDKCSVECADCGVTCFRYWHVVWQDML